MTGTRPWRPVRLARVREIGWEYWDPIGIGPPRTEFADEYDGYLMQAFGLLRRGSSKDAVVDVLMTIEAGHIGLGDRPDAEQRAAATVEALLAYVVELDRAPNPTE